MRREERVAAGLSELERWLADQIRQGIASARQSGPADWDDLAKRLIDAQAPGVAGIVARLSGHLREDDWPERLLAEYGLVHLLSVAYQRSAELTPELRETVRSRVGFTVARERVLAQPPIRDVWDVIGARDEIQDRLISRRVWLHGRSTGRTALILTFTPVGQPVDPSTLTTLVTGAALDADVTFYPGAAPLRALLAERYGVATPAPPAGVTVSEVPQLIADALAGDPWLESWPVILANVTPTNTAATDEPGQAWMLADADSGAALPLHPAAGVPWRLLAVSGGRPVTVATEWTPRGMRLLTTWDEDHRVVIL
ncbi:SWIM zinc finger family protein [Streptosporangiaceae bacterium NEAU-GS5]|nr:SWIM zinc finger family protein [Streptosporangiaceae bacterium NEAU-GS5]